MNSRRPGSRALGGAALILLCLAAVAGLVYFVSARLNTEPPVGTDVPFLPEPLPGETLPEDAYVRPEQNRSYNFLCCGTDVATGLSDTVILLHVEADGGLCAVQLPRDTYIEYGDRAGKLNECLANLGTDGAARLLEQALCIKIDYTVQTTTEAFAAAVDAVGGVPVDIPFDMDYDDPYQNLAIHLKKGPQILDGSSAEQFVRYRSGYADGDLGRLDAQKDFLLSLLRTLRQNLTYDSAAKIVTDVFPRVTTDLTLSDCIWFVRLVLAHGTGADGLSLMTAPGRALWTPATGTSYYVLGRSAMLQTVNTWLNVYKSPVEDTLFDRGRCFVRDGDEDFERIYTYSIITAETVTGE